MRKEDCLSYEKKIGGCRALSETVCETKKCSFYKNKTMLDEQVAKIRKRIPDYDPDKRLV